MPWVISIFGDLVEICATHFARLDRLCRIMRARGYVYLSCRTFVGRKTGAIHAVALFKRPRPKRRRRKRVR